MSSAKRSGSFASISFVDNLLTLKLVQEVVVPLGFTYNLSKFLKSGNFESLFAITFNSIKVSCIPEIADISVS